MLSKLKRSTVALKKAFSKAINREKAKLIYSVRRNKKRYLCKDNCKHSDSVRVPMEIVSLSYSYCGRCGTGKAITILYRENKRSKVVFRS